MAIQTPSPGFRSVAARSVTLASLLVFAGVAAGAGPAHGQCVNQHTQPSQNDLYPALKQAVDTYFAQRQKTQGFPGISVHISLSAQGPDYDVASGSTSFVNGQPICPGTLFQIGSVTKSFTSVLLLKLEAAGVLNIHDTLDKWLPEYPAWSSITIEQLLNMTAPTLDFSDQATYQQDFVDDFHRAFTPAQLVGYTYPTIRTGPVFFYSNTNYALAEIIFERAASLLAGHSVSYADALKKMLLKPLQLHETYYQPRVAPKRVLDAMTSAYDNLSLCMEAFGLPSPCAQQPMDDLLGQDLKATNLSAYGAAGGIVASLPNVTSWVRALFSGELLPAKQQTELFSLVSRTPDTGQPIATTSSDITFGYGLGVGQWWDPATGPLWFYGGETFGSRVQYYRLPGDDLVVAIGEPSAGPGDAAALYDTLLGILEPQKVINPSALPPPPPSED